MNPKAIIPLIAGVAIAGFAGKLGFDYLRKAEGGEVKRTQVWSAAVDIPLGTAIDESMLKAVKFPSAALPPGAFTDKSKLIGRVPRMSAPANLPVLETMLSPPGTSPGVIVPPGLRAVALKVDESSGVDNHLRPGAYVDVVGFFNRRNSKDTIARTIVENVQVAAVGERVSNITAEDPDAKKASAQRRPPRAVTLFVKPEQVPALHLSEQEGKIKLSMRGNDDSPQSMRDLVVSNRDVIGDDGEPRPSGAGADSWIGQLMEQFGTRTPPPADAVTHVAPTPPQPPKPAWTMVVVNGGERRLLGWSSMTSIEPMELSPEGGSLFQDAPLGLPMRLTPPRHPPGVSRDPHQTPTQMEPESTEPEELHE